MDQQETWMARSRCAIHADLPWIEDPSRVRASEEQLMAKVCAGCPVEAPCLRFVEREQISSGFWAGAFRDHHAGQSVESAA